MKDDASGDVPPPSEAAVTAGQGIQVGDHSLQVNFPFGGRQPAGPVVVGSVPQAPAAFQVREELLSRLRDAGPGAPVVRMVTGMTGIGKSQLAAAYARECRNAGWRLIAWVEAETIAAALNGLAVVADRLGITRAGKTLEATGREVRNRLEADGDECLVVFDDVTDLGDLQSYLPSLGNVRVVLTRTQSAPTGDDSAVQVDGFSRDEALAFLTKRTGRDDQSGALSLARELGFLPLALAQAASVIAVQHITYRVYLERLKSYPVLKHLPRAAGDPYPRGAAEAILLSVDAVLAADPGGLCSDLLAIVSLLSPGGVSRSLLYESASAGIFGPDTTDSAERIDTALSRLGEASLLSYTTDNSAVSVHRLVMRVVREKARHDGTLRSHGARTIELLNSNMAKVTVPWQTPLIARELVQQASAVTDHLGADADPQAVLRLRGWSAWCINDLGDSPLQASELATAAAAEAERLLGATDPQTLTLRNNAVFAHVTAGQTAKAVEVGEAVLTDCEQTIGPEAKTTLIARHHLASAYDSAGRTADAVPLFERVLREAEGTVPPADPTLLAAARNNLASAYLETGRENEAIEIYKSVLAERESALGKEHRDTVSSRNSLAHAYRKTEQYDKAVPLYESAFADATKVLGSAHPLTLTVASNLASAYLALGQSAEAVPVLESVLIDRKKILGREHPQTLSSLNNLAYAYRATGQTNKAIDLYETALAGLKRTLGPDHPQTAIAQDNLAVARSQVEPQGQAPPD